MSERFEKLKSDLGSRLDAAKARMSEACESVDKANAETKDAIAASLSDARSRVDKAKADADGTKAKVEHYFEEKKAETESAIAQWKHEREVNKLEKRASKDEDYAVMAVVMAVAAINEAEMATLQSIASRLDAELVKSE